MNNAEQRAIAAAKARDRRRRNQNAEIDAFIADVEDLLRGTPAWEEYQRVKEQHQAAPLGPLKWKPNIDHDAEMLRVKD